MQLTAILSTIAFTATIVSGAAVPPPPMGGSPPTPRPSQAANPAKASCPPHKPDFNGWFDKANNRPPQCIPHTAKPGVITKPTCGRNEVAYCARDPLHFGPYNARNEFCQDNGINRVQCFDKRLDEDAITALLQDVFSLLDDVLELLGIECLLDVLNCDPDWKDKDLTATLDEILEDVGDIVRDVLKLVDELLDGLLGPADVPALPIGGRRLRTPYTPTKQ